MTNNRPTLASFGCSFVFGSDLPDDGSTGLWHIPSNLTWPALLAKKIDYVYDCRAKPGSGNLQIAETLHNHIVQSPADIYIVGWTWIDRYDRVDDSADDWPASHTKWKTLLPNNPDPISDFYFRNLHNEYQDKFTSLLYIKNTIDLLLQQNKTFVMTCMDNLVFDRTWHTSPGVSFLQDYCKPYMKYFHGMDFLNYSKSMKFTISKSMHPLADAHESAAEIMLPVLQKMLVM
jgi:hypothetical protein